MRRSPILACSALALALALTACSPQPEGAVAAAPTAEQVRNESQRLNAWFDAQYEEWMRFSPIMLTFYGSKDLNDQIDDASEEGLRRRLEWMQASVATMEAEFDRDHLDDETRLSWDLWTRQYEDLRDGMPFMRNGYPFDQMNGMHSMLPTFLINFHKVEDEQDYLAYLSRLGQVPRFFDQLLTHARASAEQGILPPRFALEGVVDQSRRVVSGAPFDDGEDSALWADLQRKADALAESGEITTERAEELKQQARTALVEQFKPAYDAVTAWSEQEQANALVNPSGVGTTHPNGAEYYAHQLRQNTTTSMTADQIHQLGLDEVARLRGEMEAIMEQVGFEGDLQAFFAFINTDPQFRYPNTDAGRQAYIDDATAAIENIKQVLPEYFGILPKADLVVRRVEPFREQDGAAQHYYPGTADGSRPGIYYAHLSDMDAMPRTEMEVIAYHEGLPGHHMQISIAQELQDIPVFRTRYGSTVYAEGWGLYSEWLAKEVPGTYEDPYSDYGRLMSEMWRAVRLVVDTGMHAKGWTQQEALDYFSENGSIPQAAMESEIQRYLIMPGQATAYKVGMIRIQELRRKAETELGEDFDIRGFHDTVLGGGAMPLDLLERRVDQWIERTRAG
ncbi:DUF885 domain-containing protein [Alkalisalibacterium limincola]|uniref:DUF885 domain-containing protein n=1 Tax=Alkalisalibacterium limincola TaxID=2699169 RepID=A0A5C8KNE0_9GAMM|nr:DUF885 domain-containing protein [Alkalisalibacterium limincola]TXK61020.1 DUF885 domain-containing protein [Alkalisalibacterium limincola]